MNRNRIISAVCVTLSATLLISTANSIPAKASAVAGAVASMQGIKEPVIEAPSSLSGTNLAILNMLIKAEKDFDEGIVMEEKSVGALVVEPAEETVQSEEPAGESFAHMAIANVNDYVNMRAEASEEAEVVGKMYQNAASVVLEIVGDWAHVISGNLEGYVHTDYLIIGDEEVCKANSQIVARVTVDALNVRRTPDNSNNDNIFQSASMGDGYRVLDTLDDDPLWIKVAVGDGEGYVYAEFVSVNREYASIAESREEEQRRLAAEKAEEERQKRAAEEEARRKSERSSSSSSSSSSSGSSSQSSSKSYTPPTGSDGASVANFALQFVGNPYRYGGTSLTNGTDCSGFVMSVYSNFGVGLPHSSSSLRSVGYGVGASDMQAGDIVCYSGHVGICIGGGQIVHASNRRDGIKVSSAYYRNILAVRRIY